MAAYFEERAKGGVGLIVTGGIVNGGQDGWLKNSKLTTKRVARKHRQITEAVHKHDDKIGFQILHSGKIWVSSVSVSSAVLSHP